MKILLVCTGGGVNLPTSCLKAFNKLGHETYYYDYYKEVIGLHRSLTLPFLGDISRFIWSNEVDKKLIEHVQRFNPDFVFIVQGKHINPNTIEYLKNQTHALIFNWNPDNPFKKINSSRNHIKSLKLYDCYFIWGKYLIQDIRKYGCRNVEYLPFCYDPDLLHPVKVSSEDKKKYGSDVVFVGTWEKERVDWMEPITDFDLAIWGNSWENLKPKSPLRKCWRANAIYGEEMSKIFCSSKIVLNFMRKQNGNAHNARTFEVPACRSFLLTERTLEQTQILEEGKEIECFSTPQELREKITYYLNQLDKVDEIRENAYQKVKNKDTFVNRMSKVLDVYERLKSGVGL